MIETPEIITTPRRDVAVIRFTIPRAEMMQAFGPGVQELMGVLAAQGLAPTGAVFAHHYRITKETFDFDLGVPVGRPVTASGRVKPDVWPTQRAARTVYHGGYEGLPGAWGEFTAWMQGQGVAQAEDLWESYTAGPQTSADPKAWRTELVRPLVEK
ncbi:MAG TPA: GyrI-like domain-containing protein [Gemmatimonadales bacterium]|nr:GyrI-like domain-containing protein [Gemmatimonadales bacterium]